MSFHIYMYIVWFGLKKHHFKHIYHYRTSLQILAALFLLLISDWENIASFTVNIRLKFCSLRFSRSVSSSHFSQHFFSLISSSELGANSSIRAACISASTFFDKSDILYFCLFAANFSYNWLQNIKRLVIYWAVHCFLRKISKQNVMMYGLPW